jgi:pyrroloquinoline-quinone synthase
MGIDRKALASPTPPLEPEALEYRAMLDRVSIEPPWIVGAAVLTIFVEGSVNERAELAGTRAVLPVEDAVLAHPMVKFYGCPPASMRLMRAHRAVEGDHRKDAWQMLLAHAPAESTLENSIVAAMDDALAAWLRYRDSVARAMGVEAPM